MCETYKSQTVIGKQSHCCREREREMEADGIRRWRILEKTPEETKTEKFIKEEKNE